MKFIRKHKKLSIRNFDSSHANTIIWHYISPLYL